MKYLTILIIAVFMFSCSDKDAPVLKNNAIPIQYTIVKKEPYIKTLIKSGIVSKRKETALSFKLGGYIKHLSVNPGDNVKKGQVLATLDLTEIESKLSQAEVNVKKYERDFKRIQNLYSDSVVSFQNYEDIKSAYAIAKSEFKIATYNYNNAVIRAKSDGKILQKMAEEDQLIGPGQPIYFFSDNESKTIIKMGLSDKDFIQLSLNDEADINFDIYNETFKGRIIELAASANPNNGLFDVVLEINNPTNKSLFTGLIGKIIMKLKSKEDILTIPINALSSANKDIAYIYILGKNLTVSKREISIHGIFNDRVTVESGVLEGEEIITEGVLYLYENAQVEIHQGSSTFSANVGGKE